MKNKTIIGGIVIFGFIIVFFVVFLLKPDSEDVIEKPKDYTGPLSGQVNENIERTTKEEDIVVGSIVTSNNINLNDYKDNITINKGGTYNLTGELNSTLRIDSKDKVTLNLNNVKIISKISSGIINLNTNDLVINIVDNTDNYIEDNGNSVYDAAIFSNGNIIINGNGKLSIKCKQIFSEGIATNNKNITINGGVLDIMSSDDGINTGGENGGIIIINNGNIYIDSYADAIDSNDKLIINDGIIYASGGDSFSDGGIDSDNGFVVNGGILISLGYNHIEMPLDESKQNVLCLNLDDTIKQNVNVSLVNEYLNELITFKTSKEINKITISHPYLNDGIYKLYVNNSHNGELSQGIYMDGELNIKDVVKFNKKGNIIINGKITNVNGDSKKGGDNK